MSAYQPMNWDGKQKVYGYIECDSRGCEAKSKTMKPKTEIPKGWTFVSDGPHAAAWGWVIGMGKHYCPDHQPMPLFAQSADRPMG